MYLTVCLLVFCFCVALLTHVRSSAGDERCAAGSGVALVFACSRRRRLCRVEWRAESESMSHSIFRSSLILLTALLRASHCTSCGLRATGLRAALRPVIERGAFSSLPPLFQQGPGLPSVSCNCSHSLHFCLRSFASNGESMDHAACVCVFFAQEGRISQRHQYHSLHQQLQFNTATTTSFTLLQKKTSLNTTVTTHLICRRQDVVCRVARKFK